MVQDSFLIFYLFLDDEFDETSLLKSCNLDGTRNESAATVSRDASTINGNTIFSFLLK